MGFFNRRVRRDRRAALNRVAAAEISLFLVLDKLINGLPASVVAVWRIKTAVYTAMQICAADWADRTSVNMLNFYWISALPAHTGFSV